MINNNPSFAFFGTSEFAVHVLDELHKAGLDPKVVVTTPGKPAGRKLLVTDSPAKRWALAHSISVLEPKTLRDGSFLKELREKFPSIDWDLFVVASYGKIIPEDVLYLPKHKTLNVHPSILPLLRGPAPIETSILVNMQDTGVTIMLLDKEVDHGPIVAQERMKIEPWPIDRIALEKTLGEAGGKLLADTMPKWIKGEIREREQDHSLATFTKKVEKGDALLDLSDDPYANLLKIKAYASWPKAHLFDEHGGKKTRIAVTDARLSADGSLELLKVIPEGKKEMGWQDYLRGRSNK